MPFSCGEFSFPRKTCKGYQISGDIRLLLACNIYPHLHIVYLDDLIVETIAVGMVSPQKAASPPAFPAQFLMGNWSVQDNVFALLFIAIPAMIHNNVIQAKMWDSMHTAAYMQHNDYLLQVISEQFYR